MNRCVICQTDFIPAINQGERQVICRSKPCMSKYRVMKTRELKAERALAAKNNKVQHFLCHYPAMM